MIDQLKPESTNNSKGLKNTVESHILERNKYEHKPIESDFENNIVSNKITPAQFFIFNLKIIL